MKRFRSAFSVLLCIVFLLSAVSLASCSSDTDKTTGEWLLKDAKYLPSADTASPDDGNVVFYEIFVGSFSDSDGDGVGDLRGIINRMDYLNDGDPSSGKSLGVQGIWLTPIFRSPSYHKYDATSYEDVDPSFGTAEDLKDLIALCKQRNVKLILDLVINHTGKSHIWFSKFSTARLSGDASDPYYNYYVTPEDAETLGIHGAQYGYLPGSTIQYECNFSSDMPELNYDNQKVREEMLSVAEKYLDMGVDGFRFDAAKYIYYGNQPKNVEFWEWYCGELKKKHPDIYTVAEVWDSDPVAIPYTKATTTFNFTVADAEGMISSTAKKGNVNTYTAYMQNYLKSISDLGGNAHYAPFISNHDMDRAAGYNTIASGYALVSANVLLLGPGSPFIYYGDEIGMKGTRGSAMTDANRRLAMLWGDGDTVKDPVGTTYESSKQTNGTVKEQIASKDSLYSHYKKLISLRKAYPEIARGEYSALYFEGIKFGGFLSTYEGKTVSVCHNTSGASVTVDLDNVLPAGLRSASIRLEAAVGAGSASLSGKTLTVDGQTSVVLRIG